MNGGCSILIYGTEGPARCCPGWGLCLQIFTSLHSRQKLGHLGMGQVLAGRGAAGPPRNPEFQALGGLRWRHRCSALPLSFFPS